ncbi:hypothetical protein JB92DRAFT_2986882 [Gautieria morchelliformis]|nr:hypothetical protein JB92DRAFT_2986882 [Gautieria morchelliformis]
MTITNLPSYPPPHYLSSPYHLPPPISSSHHHPHGHVHSAHSHSHHHPPHHAAYSHHPHPSHHSQPPGHVLAGPVRSEPVARKRPKYTRSKTGCLTCRVKKIKCDETKPICTRCAHGQRDCSWPEIVPSRKKLTVKKESEEPDRTLSPDSASPASSTPLNAREGSPARRSPLGGLSGAGGAVSGRRTHSEPNTAAGSPAGSPIDPPHGASSRRPSLPQNIHGSSSVAYSSSSQPLRQHYPSLTPPSVSPGSYHPSPASSHEYPSYSGPPASNGHGGRSHHNGVPRHGLPSMQTSQSRLSDLGGPWHAAPMMTSGVDPIEPFYRTVQERNLMGRSPASYAS